MGSLERGCILKAVLVDPGHHYDHELLEFLRERVADAKFGKDRVKEHQLVACSLDWFATLDSTTDLVNFGKALWSAYQHFVQERGSDRAFLFVHVKNRRRESIQFCLRKDRDDESDLVRHFPRQVAALMRPQGVVRPRELTHGMLTKVF